MVDLPSNRRFVGRATQLRRLESGLEAAAAGRPELFVMGGEAGVGKTRLAEEFVARAAGAGATTLVGGCVDVEEGGLPLGPFVEALRDHARGLEDASREQLLAPGGVELARLLPDLGGPAAGPAPAIGASTQGRLFELALGLLGRMASDRPLVLVLEDLHWSETSEPSGSCSWPRTAPTSSTVDIRCARSWPSWIVAAGRVASTCARSTARSWPSIWRGSWAPGRRGASSSRCSSARRATRSSPRSS
jgi:hypothetical protein